MKGAALLPALWACAGAIGCALPANELQVAGRDGAIVLSFRPEPAGFSVDRPFSLIVHGCSRQPLTLLSVDAHMPEHRHGMNYKASLAVIAPGTWRADGLLLHMPGKWEFVFVAMVDGQSERLTLVTQVP